MSFINDEVFWRLAMVSWVVGVAMIIRTGYHMVRMGLDIKPEYGGWFGSRRFYPFPTWLFDEAFESGEGIKDRTLMGWSIVEMMAAMAVFVFSILAYHHQLSSLAYLWRR